MVKRIQLGFSEQWLAKMITQSDDTWAILKSLPDRPEIVPRGYEFLPDAIKRDVEPHGVKALELVQQALGEGDIVALLQGHLGHRKPIPQRIWNKHPLIRKVYPRFTDGKMRMGLHDHEGPHLVGWVFVYKGELRKVLQNSISTDKKGPQTARFSPAELERRYIAYVEKKMAVGDRPSREADREAMSKVLGVTIPHKEIRKVREKHAPDIWKVPGRRPKKSGRK